ncbi:MAG: hypothetical protein KJ858_01090, partial [Nanoarchaeota archaeon]|nr:hypothetical protein [Nanoarchaeota archaeon]
GILNKQFEVTVNTPFVLWARIENKGFLDAQNIEVDFYQIEDETLILLNSTIIPGLQAFHKKIVIFPELLFEEIGNITFMVNATYQEGDYVSNDVDYYNLTIVPYPTNVSDPPDNYEGDYSYTIEMIAFVYNCTDDVIPIELYNNGQLLTRQWFDCYNYYWTLDDYFFTDLEDHLYFNIGLNPPEPGTLELRFEDGNIVTTPHGPLAGILRDNSYISDCECDNCCPHNLELKNITKAFANDTSYFNFGTPEQNEFISVYMKDKHIGNSFIYANDILLGKTSGGRTTKKFEIPSELLDSDIQVKIVPNCSDFLGIECYYDAKVSLMPDLGDLYLTIVAAPNAVPYFSSFYVLGLTRFAFDQTIYADIDGDHMPDLSSGRIQGITSSDVSSYIARALFFDNFGKTDNIEFLARSYDADILVAHNWTLEFNSSGYNAHCSIEPTDTSGEDYVCDITYDPGEDWPTLYENRNLLMYMDHGSDSWAGIRYSQIPNLHNSIIIDEACLTCSSYDGESFCNTVIRRGGLAHFGAVSLAFAMGNSIYKDTINKVFIDNLTLGEAFLKSYNNHPMLTTTAILGDPTLNINATYSLNNPLKWP